MENHEKRKYRVKSLHITRYFLETIKDVKAIVLKDGTIIEILEGLPDDARIIQIYYDDLYDRINLIFDSKEFPVLKTGELIPPINLTLHTTKIGEGEEVDDPHNNRF